MFKLFWQNQAELAKPAVLCFWHPCKCKQSEIRVAYYSLAYKIIKTVTKTGTFRLICKYLNLGVESYYFVNVHWARAFGLYLQRPNRKG